MSDQTFYADLNSWILYTIRDSMGVGDIRKDILQYYLKNLEQQNKIEYGPTFSIGIPKSKLYKYLDYIIECMELNQDKIILFTCNNSYGPWNKKQKQLMETHYQTFIVQTGHKRITMIDPSRKRAEMGIYDPYASMAIYFYIKPRIHTKFYWLKTTNPCQVYFSLDPDNDDVYCQSWSLYLQKEALLKNKTVIQIPYEIETKYDILINFYKEILKNVDSFAKEFNVKWEKNISDYNLDYKNIDALDYITKMKGSDLYTNKGFIEVDVETEEYVNVITVEEVGYFLEIFINSNTNKVITPDMSTYLKVIFQKKSPERESIITPKVSGKSPKVSGKYKVSGKSPKRKSTKSPRKFS